LLDGAARKLASAQFRLPWRRVGSVTPVTYDPLALAVDVERATARLLKTAAALDDAALSGPSLLPGWTRGHVLTHLARNADGAVNLLTWARTGEETPQYASLDGREADIEAGAGRPAVEQVADITTASDRLAAAVAEMPPKAWAAVVRWTSGPEAPAARVMWSRLREVEIHHVDLATGYAPADWPEAFSLRMLRSLARDFSERDDGPRLIVRSPEVGHDVPIGPDGTEPVVTGPASSVVAWLIGRSAGDGLTVQPSGPLPPLPSWS
jgi:maleylpyruvate isomerase